MAGESHAGITVPEGNAGALRDMARTFGGLGGAMERTGAQFGAMPAELPSWQGGASVSFASLALQSRAVADQAGRSFSIKARAVRSYADELEEAQRETRSAIEDARDAERRIDRARELIDDAQLRLEDARGRAALAEFEIFATGLSGAPASGALDARAQADRDIEQATGDVERGRRLLEQAREDLEHARRRGRRAEERAEDASRQVESLLASTTPAATLPLLGGPATGIGGLTRLGPWQGGLDPSQRFSPLLTLSALVPAPAGSQFGGFLPLLPLALLGTDGTSKALGGASGGLGDYSAEAGRRNRALRGFHARALGSLGDPEFNRYLLSPEARAQQRRMRTYHDDELARAQDAGDDISKLKTAGKFLGPLGDGVGAKANADEGMPWLENFLRTGGSWGLGAAGASGGGILCAPSLAGAAGCATGGAIVGGEIGDRAGGALYDGLDWTYQNGIEPGLEKGYDKLIRPVGEGLGKVGRLFP